MTDEVIPFVPGGSAEATISKEVMRAAAEQLRPDMDEERFEETWASFVAMRERVDNPRRRQGADVRRIGPVIFDPCQYVRRDLANDGAGQ